MRRKSVWTCGDVKACWVGILWLALRQWFNCGGRRFGTDEWYSVLHGDGVGIYGKPAADGGSSAASLSHFTILGEVTERNDNPLVNGIGGALNSSTVSDLWIQHSEVGAWMDGRMNHLTMTGLRILDQTADGVNFHQGVTDSVVENGFIRNTGDDDLPYRSGVARLLERPLTDA